MLHIYRIYIIIANNTYYIFNLILTNKGGLLLIKIRSKLYSLTIIINQCHIIKK